VYNSRISFKVESQRSRSPGLVDVRHDMTSPHDDKRTVPSLNLVLTLYLRSIENLHWLKGQISRSPGQTYTTWMHRTS